MDPLLNKSTFLNFDTGPVAEFIDRAIAPTSVTPQQKAIDLYYAVRDGIHYEIYGTDLSEDGLRASSVVTAGQGFCLHKSILYAATTRAVGIPSKIVCSHVRNHVSSPNLQRLVGGDVFLHWLNLVHLDGRWVKVTPVFGKLLCRMYGMVPLEFDGIHDSVFQPINRDSTEVMEFLGEEQVFTDVDHTRFTALIAAAHPNMCTSSGRVPGEQSLLHEVDLNRRDGHS